MKALLDLRVLFVATAVLEAFYTAAALLTPPDLVSPLFGWNMSPDGHWALKLLGVALGAQALTAWVLRRQPTASIALCLAAYQIGATVVDIVMWQLLAERGIFDATVARSMILAAIPTHLFLGVLLIVAAARTEHPARLTASQ
jgi:hypothetical protein